jgi:hypothetical protein
MPSNPDCLRPPDEELSFDEERKRGDVEEESKGDG